MSKTPPKRKVPAASVYQEEPLAPDPEPFAPPPPPSVFLQIGPFVFLVDAAGDLHPASPATDLGTLSKHTVKAFVS